MIARGCNEEVIIAGFGGQGVIMTGKLLATAAMKMGHEVTYMRSYGPEVRGGTANSTIVISDEPIASPVVNSFDSLIVMNLASFERFVPMLKPGGLLVMNSSLIDEVPERDDIEVLLVPADDIAVELGSDKSSNMVALGAYLERRKLVSIDTVAACFHDVLAARHHKTIPANTRALTSGAQHCLSVAG